MTTTWRRVLATTVALAPFLVLAAAEWPLQPDLWYSDFAQYVAHARALAEGRAYTDTGYIFVQKAIAWAPRAYPPGLPLALAPVVWLFGGQIGAVKAWMILLSASSIVMAGAWFWRRIGALAGIGVIAMVGLSPQWVALSVSPLSDVVFVGTVWAVLLVADHEREWSWGRVAAVTALMAASLAVRPHGLVLLPALAVWGFVRRRATGPRVFVPPVLLTGALVAARMALPPGSVRTAIPARMIEELLRWDPRYHLAIFESHLYPFPWNAANDAYHVLTAALLILGLAVLVRRLGVALPLVFAGLYVLALGSFDPADPRYAFPLYPLFVFGMLNGICWLVRRRNGRWAGRITLATAGALALVAVVRGVTAPRVPRLIDEPDYRGIVEWVEGVRGFSPDPVSVAFFRPRVLAWEAGVRAMPLLSWPHVAEHVDEWCANDIDYVILGSVGERMAGRRMDRTAEAIALRPEVFERAYGNGAFEAYRLRRDLACTAPTRVTAPAGPDSARGGSGAIPSVVAPEEARPAEAGSPEAPPPDSSGNRPT